MTKARKSEHDHIHDARERLLDAALPHVTFDGWSRAALDAAIAEADVEPELARLAFPRGGIDMLLAFHRRADRRLAEELAQADLESMRLRERIAHCVRQRIELVADYREAVRRGAALLALPIYAPEGAKLIWETADTIWTACGDTATDVNWYTKRMSLAAVYSATMLYWLGDASPNFAGTWAFLDRRIDEVMNLEKARAQMEDNPFVRAALWGPRQFMNLFRRPDQDPGSGPGAASY